MAEYIPNLLESTNASVKGGKGVEKEHILSWYMAHVIPRGENEMHVPQEQGKGKIAALNMSIQLFAAHRQSSGENYKTKPHTG